MFQAVTITINELKQTNARYQWNPIVAILDSFTWINLLVFSLISISSGLSLYKKVIYKLKNEGTNTLRFLSLPLRFLRGCFVIRVWQTLKYSWAKFKCRGAFRKIIKGVGAFYKSMDIHVGQNHGHNRWQMKTKLLQMGRNLSKSHASDLLKILLSSVFCVV